MNHIHISGHLGADPEVRVTQDGLKIITLRIASNQRKKGKDETLWYRITFWGDQYEKMVSYLKKGSPVMVIGMLQKPQVYQNKSGEYQASLEVTGVNLSFSPFGKQEKSDHPSSTSVQKEEKGQGASFSEEFSSEEIPF